MNKRIVNINHNGKLESCTVEECIPSYYFSDDENSEPNYSKVERYKNYCNYDYVALKYESFIFCNIIEDAEIIDDVILLTEEE